METYSKYFNLYSATFRNDKKVITKTKKNPTYRFTNHFHVGIHGFCGKGITTKYKILILCKKNWKVLTQSQRLDFFIHNKKYEQLYIEHEIVLKFYPDSWLPPWRYLLGTLSPSQKLVVFLKALLRSRPAFKTDWYTVSVMIYLLSKSWSLRVLMTVRLLHKPFAWRWQLAPKLYKLSCSYALNTETQELRVNENVKELENCRAVETVHRA